MGKIELAEARDMGQTIGDSILFAKQNLKVLNRSFVYYLVPILLVGAVLSAFGLKGVFGSLVNSRYDRYSPVIGGHSLAGSGVLLALGYIILIIASMIQNLYTCEFMVLYERNKDTNLADIWTAIKKDWKRTLLTYLVLFQLGAALVGLYLLVLWMADYYSRSVAGLFALVFYLLLLYAIIPLSNLMMVRLRERLGIFQSVAKAFRITAGHWWSSFISYFILGIIYYCFMFVLLIPFYIVLFISMSHRYGGGAGSSALQTGAIMGVYITLVGFWMVYLWHIFYIYIGANYYSLSEQYDNFHLREEIMKIGEKDSQPVQKQEGEY